MLLHCQFIIMTMSKIKQRYILYLLSSILSHICIAFFMLLFSSIHGNIISNHILNALYFVTLYDTALNYFELYFIGSDFFTQSSYNLRYIRRSSALYHIVSVLDKKFSDSCLIPFFFCNNILASFIILIKTVIIKLFYFQFTFKF